MGYRFDEKLGEFVLVSADKTKIKSSSFSQTGIGDRSINERVIAVIAKTLNVDKSRVTLQSSFDVDFNVDSLDVVELIMELEKEFVISIPDERIYEIRVVSDVVTLIEAEIK